MFIDRDTCGDPYLGEGCDGGRWYAPCSGPACEGMCRYEGPCLCRGCGSPACCARWQTVGGALVPAMLVYDERVKRNVLRPIIEGPPVP